jgi:hypothetical protein
MASQRRQLLALKRLLNQADLTLYNETSPGAARCRELVTVASALAADLLKTDRLPAAAILGAKGGQQTAKRGPDYFRKLAAKRKTHAGGRPRKES